MCYASHFAKQRPELHTHKDVTQTIGSGLNVEECVHYGIRCQAIVGEHMLFCYM